MEGNCSLSIAHKLPPELLAHVFEILQISLGWTWSNVNYLHGAREHAMAATWIHVTWVCCYWRLVALTSPPLWTLIVLDSSRLKTWAATFLGRSQEMPLNVSIGDFTQSTQTILSMCLHHAHRISRLRAEGPLGLLLAPLTRTFDILEEAYLRHRDDQGSSVSNTLHFRREDFPCLHTLEIAFVDVAWEAFSLQSLRELRLNAEMRGLSTTSLLRIIRDSPGLRVLRVGRSVTLLPALEDQANTGEAISLVHLRQIHLYGTPQELAYVLDNFTVPSGNFHIHLLYAWNDSWLQRYHSIDMLLPRQLAFRSLLPHCTTLKLFISGSDTRIVALNESRTSLLSIKMSNEQLFAEGLYPMMREDIWISIFDAFSCSALSCFWVTCGGEPSNFTIQIWTALFGRFPLHTVRMSIRGLLQERGTVFLLENLFTAMRDPIAHRVSTLEFFFLSLNSETTGAILDLLGDRASMGVPLERLVFVWCLCESSLDREALKERLENVVDLVIRYGEDTYGQDTEDEFRAHSTNSGPSGGF